MKNILFINACVRGGFSRTLKVAQEFIKKCYDTQSVNIIHRDLTGGEVEFYTNASFDAQTGETRPTFSADYAMEFANADEIVVAAPFWEFVFPAVLSCYFEMVSVPNITFRYTQSGSAGLCKAQRLTYIYTAGDALQPDDRIGEQLLQALCNLYGIKQYSAISAVGLDIDGNSPEDILREVCDDITR